MYPEDCIQSILENPDEWWVPDKEKPLSRGSLIYSFIPHIDQVPYAFEPVGRTKATEHHQADVVVGPLKVNQPLKKNTLPVAAMPTYKGEVWAAYRAKRRPCLVLGEISPAVDKSLTRRMPRSLSASTVLVAPYFGADKDGTRAGYNQMFVDRIKHCVYPQYIWDRLPMAGGPDASILRLDQMQSIGTHHDSYKQTGYKLCDDAVEILDDLVTWMIWGGLPADSDLVAYCDLMQETFP